MIEFEENKNIPRKVFIIPYRDRKQHRELFITYMIKVLEDEKGSYKFFFIHQNDKRPFNRGAMKNIGFLYVKNIYPNDYKNITLIFHDIDLMPWKKNIFDYDTTHGIVKHYYGFTFTLGGMVAIKGSDFEKINGFPNYWSWGFEDNLLQVRWLRSGGTIDRSQFLHIQHPDVLASHHGFNRTTSKINENNYIYKDKHDIYNSNGINKIQKLKYNVIPLDLDIDSVDVNFFITHIPPSADIKNEHLSNIINRFNNDSNVYEKQQKLNNKKTIQKKTQNKPVQSMSVQQKINQRKIIDTSLLQKKANEFMFKY